MLIPERLFITVKDMKTIKLNIKDLNEMVRMACNALLNESAPIDKEMNDNLKSLSEKCVKILNSFNPDNAQEYDVDEQPQEGTWYIEDYDEENDRLKYFTPVTYPGFPTVILIRDPWNYAHNAAYNQGSNEIWLVCRGNETPEKVHSRLYHEMIHYLDDTRYNSLRTAHENDDTLPRCFNWVFYVLWNKNELRAHAYQWARYGREGAQWTYRKKLLDEVANCLDYPEDDPVWQSVSKYVWGERRNAYNTRNKFISRTRYLLDVFYKLMMKNVTDE